MHKLETILFGIALILFGIASALIVIITDWGFFDLPAIFMPFIGIAVALIGLFDKGASRKPTDENDAEQDV